MYGHKWWLCWKISIQCGRELNFLHSDITVIILHGHILILYNWRPYLSITPRTSTDTTRWPLHFALTYNRTKHVCWQPKQEQGKNWECAYVRNCATDTLFFSVALIFTTWWFRFNLHVSGTFNIPLGPLAVSVISDWLCIDYLSRLLQTHFGETLLPKWVRIMSLNFLSINARGGYSQYYVPQFSWYLSVIGDSILISESSFFLPHSIVQCFW